MTETIAPEPREATFTLHSEDGYALGATRYEPAGEVRAQVVLHAATAAPQRFYAPFARFLTGYGLRVLTYDYRGIGSSKPTTLRGFSADMIDWAYRDAVAAVRTLEGFAPTLPLLAVGHSFGGQIAAALPEGRRPDALLTVGTQRGWYRPFDDWATMWLRWRLVVPALTRLFGYLPGAAGTKEDLPGGVARQWAGWCLHPDYYLSTHPEIGARLARYAGPVYALSFTDDAYAPLINVEWFVDRLRRAPVLHQHVHPQELGRSGVGHFGAFRPELSEALWPAMAAFLCAAAEGETGAFGGLSGVGPHAPTAVPAFTEADVALDLAYGRTD